MKKVKTKSFMLLQKSKKILAFFAIALFSVILINPMDTLSANFKYEDFDWETFKEENRDYWEGYCDDLDGADKTDCEEKILASQEKFYKKLYKILAKYEKKGHFISKDQATMVEAIILETIFFELIPSELSDDSNEYIDSWESKSGAFVIDEENGDVDEPKIDIDYTDEAMAEYFSNEKDTLKTLLKNMLASTTTCYGVLGDPQVETLSDGSTRLYCLRDGSRDDNALIVNIPVGFASWKNKCVDKLGSHEKGFWEYFVSKWENDIKLPLNKKIPFLKRSLVDEDYNKCMEHDSEYPEGANYVFEDDEHISTNKYFDFLKYNIYFDKKAHLQYHFDETILTPANVDCMTDDVCDNSLESAGLYATYEGEIIKVRKQIIDDIIQILNDYGIPVKYEEGAGPTLSEASGHEATRKSFYWPIGSDELEVRNGVTFADKDPASTDVISYFGARKNPVTGEDEWHYGIDIAGVDGVTNVIAVADGEVISAVSGCTSGDYECNEGYGNTIIISHNNGDFTVYAHLASIDSAVSVGTVVLKGQLIGKVGSTGNTNSSNLHYEIRVGGNDISFAVDPLGITSKDNPRPMSASGDFSVHSTTLTREEFITMMVKYCNSHSCSSTMLNVFVANAGLIYDVSIDNNVNPELVVVRAMGEGFSPGGSTNNYWGIACYNGAGKDACKSYSSLTDGIKGFASVVSKYNTALDMMMSYAYIGKYWYNPGSWSLGGCKYYPYINGYMSPERASYVGTVCSGASCSSKGGGSCVRTNDEDQRAYALYQVNDSMSKFRFNIFGL